jgi:putative transposase
MQNNKEDFHITASCFEHRKVIGKTEKRLEEFESELLDLLNKTTEEVFAWAVLPNHYHVLIKSYDIKHIIKAMGKLHGRKSYKWNGEDNSRGRQVWHNMLEHGIKSERHFWATMNYIHNNPVKHGYAEKWEDWKFSSANKYLDELGKENAVKVWKEYDISKMGDWDVY